MSRNVVLTKVTRPPGTLTVERTSPRIKQHERHCRLESPLQNQVNINIFNKNIYVKKNNNNKQDYNNSIAAMEINLPEL